MCFIYLMLDAILLSSSNIALRLSWNRTIFFMVKHCALIKYQVYSIWGMESSAPISPASVELLASILCFLAIPVTDPIPSDMVDLVCPLISGCAVYEASTHHLINVRMYFLRISVKLIVCLTYCRTCFNFPQSSSSMICTLVVRKESVVCISFCFLWHANISWVTAWQNSVARFSSSFFWSLSSLMV